MHAILLLLLNPLPPPFLKYSAGYGGGCKSRRHVWEQAGGQSWFFKAHKHFRE